MKIYRYQKESDEFTEYRAQGDGVQELCTLDGYTYISGPEVLPDQPAQITVELVPEMPGDLKDRIKAASPICQLIHRRMQDQIAARFPLDEELFLARISVGALRGTYQPTAAEIAEIDEYQQFVEGVREWGRQQRAELGL